MCRQRGRVAFGRVGGLIATVISCRAGRQMCCPTIGLRFISWIISIIHEILTAMADVPGPTESSRPEWFAVFIADRGTRKPSAHTMKAYG